MAKIRVSELAREYGVTSQKIIEMLTDLGEFVKSSSSGVEPITVRRLMDAYGDSLRSSRRPARQTPERTEASSQLPLPNPFSGQRPQPRRPSPSRHETPPPSKAMLEASLIFGKPVDELRPARDKDARGRYRSSESRRPVDEWTKAFFTPEEKRAWLDAGLGEHDVRLAQDCVKAKLRPEDLHTRVDGRTIASRLRGGESLRQVLARMLGAQGNRGSEAG